MKQCLNLTLTVWLLELLISCNGQAEKERKFILSHIKESYEYFNNESIKEFQSITDNLSRCSPVESVVKLEETLKKIRINTKFAIDSIFSGKNEKQIIECCDRYVLFLNEDKLGITTRNEFISCNQEIENIELMKYIVVNKLLMYEIRIRKSLLKDWAIDC